MYAVDVVISDFHHLSPFSFQNSIMSGVSCLRNYERIKRGIIAQNLSYELLRFTVAVTGGCIDHRASTI
jgi:hypothetical protein